MLSSVKAEIDRELKAEELKQILEKQARDNPLETILDERGKAISRTPERPQDQSEGGVQGEQGPRPH
ncbi:MAG: hypothetical protein MUC77_16215 [Chromatiaceae bacterium]|nr:hypothetical protein [Chromatiaceae bacterium]